MRRPNAAKLQKQVDDFNARCPIGTPVRYWTFTRDFEGREGVTRSEAQVLSGHTAVVWVTGHAGCIALSHVDPLSLDGAKKR